MAQADFWNDKSSSDEVVSELSDLKKLVDTTSKLEKEIKDSIDLIELYQDEIDEEIYKELINTDKVQKFTVHIAVSKRAPKSAEGKNCNITGILVAGEK